MLRKNTMTHIKSLSKIKKKNAVYMLVVICITNTYHINSDKGKNCYHGTFLYIHLTQQVP